MYIHLDWANQRILDHLQKNKTENNDIIRLFSHILLAEQVWYTRITGGDTNALKVWGNENLDNCEKLVKRNKDRFSTLLENLSENDLVKKVTYKNTQGKEFENSISDILTHVALHGQHHRGQINTKLRESGTDPVSIDYISMVR
jgi:uncharacterized damage-inducible protein DinB